MRTKVRHKCWKSRVKWAIAAIALLIATQTLLAQGSFTTTAPNDILSQYRDFRTTWTTNIWVYARRLFWFLAAIEFGWSVIALALDKHDLQGWIAGLIRKLMWIGAFWMLVVYGNTWIPTIIESFELIGASAAGISGPLDAGGVFAQGLTIAGALLDSGSSSAFFTNPATSLALVLVSLVIVFSYIIITINFVMTMVESYLVVSVGYIFLGFGGSRWTAPYTERFIGLAVSIGIKIVLLYCLISAGQVLGTGWLTEAQGVGSSAHPVMTAFDVMGAALIYMVLCWQIPKLFGAVLGGSPALTAGDLIGAGTALIGAGFAAASLGAGALAAAAGSGAVATTSAAAGAGASGSSGISPSGAAAVASNVSAPSKNPGPPPSEPSASRSSPTSSASVNVVSVVAGANEQVPPPSFRQSVHDVAGRASTHLGRASERIRNVRLPDSAGLSSPPRMPIDHHE